MEIELWGGLEAGGERRFPSILYGTEWGGPRWPRGLLPTVSAAVVPASSPLHKEGDRLFGHLCISTAALPGMCQCRGGEPTLVNLMQTCRLVLPGPPVLSKRDLSIIHLSRQTQKELSYHLGMGVIFHPLIFRLLLCI